MENLRYLYHSLRAGSPREVYWQFAARSERRAKLSGPEFALFARHVESEAEELEAALATGQSYPETTGYLITSLLSYAVHYRREQVRKAALAMADWEIEVQMPSGAVQGGPVMPRNKQTPAAFNTGMVLDGWCSAYEASREQRYLDAGLAAARFLVGDMDQAGYFRTNGAFVSPGETKTYNCLCAWAMLRMARLTADAGLERAAVRAVEAVLKRQHSNGWFANNCLEMSSVPLTHTIGYALQGVFEVGVLAGREDFISAAERGLGNVLSQQRPNGFLAGRFDRHWNPVLGAIAGSYPILGGYMTGGYPNWATKYFIDALLRRRSL